MIDICFLMIGVLQIHFQIHAFAEKKKIQPSWAPTTRRRHPKRKIMRQNNIKAIPGKYAIFFFYRRMKRCGCCRRAQISSSPPPPWSVSPMEQEESVLIHGLSEICFAPVKPPPAIWFEMFINDFLRPPDVLVKHRERGRKKKQSLSCVGQQPSKQAIKTST